MLFNSDDAERLLNSPENLLAKVAVYKTPGELLRARGLSEYHRENTSEVLSDGRREMRGDLEYTTAERSLSAALSQIDSQANVARMLGASTSQVQNWAHGRTGREGQNGKYDNSKVRPELVNATREKLGKIRDVAMERLLATLGVITDDDLSELDAKDASIVASNLARVVEKATPREELDGKRANIVMYMPTQMNIEQYNVVET